MKRITAELECSHTITFEAAEVPAQPNHRHVNCATCRGIFNVLRVTKVEEVEPVAVVFYPNALRGEAGTEVFDMGPAVGDVTVEKIVPSAEAVITPVEKVQE